MGQRLLLSSVFGLCGLLVCLGFALTRVPVRPRPSSYQAAVLQMLHTREYTIRAVEVIDDCAPHHQFCQTYAGVVTITSTRTLTGQIVCAERWTACTLTVLEMGIFAEPLPDVRDPLVWRWQQWEAAVRRWVRGEGR